MTEPCHAQLEFCVYLVSAVTGNHTREARALRFWFKPEVTQNECPHQAQAFFRELVSPQDFPKGKFHNYFLAYTNIIKRKYLIVCLCVE